MNIDMNEYINRYTVDDADTIVLEWKKINIEMLDY